jgi:hypothetical protein
MARRQKQNALEQGSAPALLDLFISAYIRVKPDNVPAHDWLDEIFCVKERDITRYVARRRFDLPGLFMCTPHEGIQGIGYRKVKAGSVLFVRRDSRTPDMIDVEYLGGPGKADQVFRLTLLEFNRIAAHLEEVERKKH